jgi:hypothetical protein
MVFKGRRKVAPVYCQAVNSEMFGRRASRWQRVLRQSGAARIRTLPGDRGHRSLAHQDQEPANQRQMRITQPGRKGSPPPALRLPQTKLSLKSNQIARGRFRRFESDMRSHAVDRQAYFERLLFLACGGCHAFPRRSRSVPLIAVAVHARHVEEASRHAEGISLAHRRGAGIGLGGC